MAKAKHTASTPADRRITVGSGHYPRLLDADPRNGDRAVPLIRLRGHWLAKAGFSPKDPVRIRVSKGKIVMTLA